MVYSYKVSLVGDARWGCAMSARPVRLTGEVLVSCANRASKAKMTGLRRVRSLCASFDPTYLWKKGDRREASGADVPAP